MDMHGIKELPESYLPIMHLDLQHDRKQAIIVNVIALIIAAAMIAAGIPIVPIWTLFDMSAGFGPYLARFGVLIGGMVVYLILHELVHGVFMRHFSKMRPHYGFTGMYAYAGSEAYFDKFSYIIIALAPIVILGIVIAVVNSLVSEAWFWVVYIIQIANISGAAGDLYVTARFQRLPKDIFVQDTGVTMTVYSAQS